ncbi:putative poly(glycerol-phosphate) alpha-glucosyltransferase [Acinetobacter stercoris]|uniref:Putative poly(Glycerol-phosphate) alpha-glucosyltransferase n=2 Tax=Acinetobacter stercoris TaxID=2126983 RepID=A0A2U3N3C1_9GAMM|nr:putative poly(glycerol-phosphate) alpha-glucosyltransferase [Acinetobacter stercoris]
MELVVKKHPLTQLYIYGEGGERNSLERLISEKKLNNNVFLPGYTENIADELNDSILYLSTSKMEGFPLSFLESLNHGVPIFSYDIKYGPSALIENGANGVVVEKDDIVNAANAMTLLLDDRKKLRDMSEEAYKSSTLYEMKNVAEIWKKELEKL